MRASVVQLGNQAEQAAASMSGAQQPQAAGTDGVKRQDIIRPGDHVIFDINSEKVFCFKLKRGGCDALPPRPCFALVAPL